MKERIYKILLALLFIGIADVMFIAPFYYFLKDEFQTAALITLVDCLLIVFILSIED